MNRITWFLIRIALFATQCWFWLTTIPSLDKSVRLPDGRTFHPSHGTVGSVYVTADGQHYIRTGFGSRKIGRLLGQMFIKRARRNRRRAIQLRVAVVSAAVLLVSTATYALSALSGR